MKIKLLFPFFMVVFFTIHLFAQEKKAPYHEWWKEHGFIKPYDNSGDKVLTKISVTGNVFTSEKGDTVLFRGLAIGDPDKLHNQGHWSKKHFDKVKEMGAKLVRIPVHPIAWRERTAKGYLELLDQAVKWCTELELYVIIDWHSIGNLKMGMFQNPMYETTLSETYIFWRTIAFHFKNNNTVAFYELFNEPTLYFGQLGSMSWSEWKKINEDIIAIIRSFDKETIPLVAGFDWAYDLTPLHVEPVNAERIGYVTHPYPFKRSRPWPPKWDENFGFAATKYPVIATEIGFGIEQGKEPGAEDYGNMIINYLEGKGISWVAWVYDADWHPNMLQSWNYDLSGCGAFFKKALQGEVQK
jgi:hypothetical protein